MVAGEAPVTLDLLLQMVAVAVAVVGLWLAIRREFAATRQASEEGRRRLYERIEKLEEDMDRNFVRRTEHEADLRAVHHGFEERDQLIRTLIERLTKEHG